MWNFGICLVLGIDDFWLSTILYQYQHLGIGIAPQYPAYSSSLVWRNSFQEEEKVNPNNTNWNYHYRFQTQPNTSLVWGDQLTLRQTWKIFSCFCDPTMESNPILLIEILNTRFNVVVHLFLCRDTCSIKEILFCRNYLLS